MSEVGSRDLASLDLASLSEGYRAGRLTPSAVARAILARIAAAGDDHVWITRIDADALLARAAALETGDRGLPLYGIPFAIKDNIDVAGLETTAGCPGFAVSAAATAPAVQALLDAGAMLVGKTNLDQFATGLVGVRSPYGIARNPFDAADIPGGSSSGSAVAVASGLVSFAFGTDTAGSGRVPAAFNNIVGLKPTRGLVSTSGVVPACRSLDCVSIFALTVEDALDVLRVCGREDATDAFSRAAPAQPRRFGTPFRFGMPHSIDCDAEVDRLWRGAAAALEQLGGARVPIDFAPFAEASALLYDGPWVAERTAAVGDFIAAQPDTVLPVTRTIIVGGSKVTGVTAFRASYHLAALKRRADGIFNTIDCLLLPTTPTHYTIAQVLADPIRTNSNLGRFTNFTNLLDLAAVAVPAGFGIDGRPVGVTLMALAFREAALGHVASLLHRATSDALGATGVPMPSSRAICYDQDAERNLFVVGAHLDGQPLNHQLTELGGYLVSPARTAPAYRFHALAGSPARPGLVRVLRDGASIEGEIWALTPAALGRFMDHVRPPLAIGTIELDDGRQTKGFVCEATGVAGAKDITSYGGWRAFLADS